MKAYSAGVAEGAITKELIYQHLRNTVAGYCDGVDKYCKRLESFLRKNIAWMKAQVEQRPNDPYWHQVRLSLLQLSGLSDGYFGTVSAPHLHIAPFGLLMLQVNGDLFDLEVALHKPKGLRRRVTGSGSCSAFIKPLADHSDLLFSHVSWSTYQSMLRVLKKYSLSYGFSANSTQRINGHTVTFSSYPGYLSSLDDFYLTNRHGKQNVPEFLAVTETTIENSNTALLKYIKPAGGVLTWIRSQLANRLASTAADWVAVFRKYNSGTYNNQWMVVDYKQVTRGAPLPTHGLFYVLEQLPGHVKSEDMTSFLMRQGYWPSYNVPFFPEIFNLSGTWSFVKKYGDWFTYDRTPRALIFKRDWRNVTDMRSLQRLMRYNDYTHDPLSRCACRPPYSAENAISARCDLNPANGTYPFASLGHRSHGAIDMKATNSQLVRRLQFVAVGGPTFDQQPPFRWSTADFGATTPHWGQPDLWRFEPVLHRWSPEQPDS